MKKAIVAAIAVAFFVSTAAEARGGRGFSGGRSFSRPAPTKSYAPKRTTVVKKNTTVINQRHGFGCRLDGGFYGGQCHLRLHDEGRRTEAACAGSAAGHLCACRPEREAR